MLAILGLLGGVSFTFGLLTAVAAKIPQLDPAKQHTQANTYVYAADGHTVLSILRGSQARIIVPSQAISPWMKHSIVAIEDKRFYQHRGVDVRGMGRALWADISNEGTVQGGSTITQQFVKNTFLTNQKSIGRKLIEAALAWQLEQKWSKDRILTAYLNTVYFGNGAYGVEQAARVYFQHPAAVMKPAEAALLAGIPQNPSLWDPVAHPAAAKLRRDIVLRQLYIQGYLTRSQYVNSRVYPMPDPAKVSLPSTQSLKAPYFANYVKDQLVKRFGPRKTFGGGLKVTTTLDMNLQQMARDAIATALPPSTGPTAALVALDARTGAVLAMVGGENYHKSQFNLATQGERQPGSSFKPFVLATALKQGIAPSSILTSSKHVTINAGGRLWEVNNYEGEALGPIDLTKAIAYSDNSVFSQLTAIVGPGNVATTARALGITTPLKGYFAIGLGAEPATPLEMARAYGSFADGGYRIDGSIFGNEPRAVQELKVNGKTEVNNVVPHAALGTAEESQARAAIIDSLLQGVVQYGTGTAAALPGRQVAGKTGTTENFGDAWFVGYTPQLVVAVWVGYPDKLIPMLTEFHGHPVAGGTYPALDLEGLHDEGACLREGAARRLHRRPRRCTPAPSPSSTAAGCSSATTASVTTPSRWSSSAAKAPRGSRRASRTRSRSRTRSASHSPTRRRGSRASRSTPSIVYKPARTGDRVGYRGRPVPAPGDGFGLRQDHAHPGEVAPRRDPESGRAARSPRAQARLAHLHLRVHVKGGTRGRVVAQSLPAQTAAAPGISLTLTVKRQKA